MGSAGVADDANGALSQAHGLCVRACVRATFGWPGPSDHFSSSGSLSCRGEI